MSWLEELKPGDHVFVTAGSGLTPGVVDRVTATQLAVAVGHRGLTSKFRRRDGWALGQHSAWDLPEMLVENNPENRNRYGKHRIESRRLKLADRLADVRLLRRLTLEQLERIKAITEEATP